MSAVNKWNIFCEIENKNIEILSTSGNPPPTSCPNSPEHFVMPEKTFLIEVIQDKEVKIKEETIPTQGFYKIEGKIMDCPANTISVDTTNLKRPSATLAFYLSPSPDNFKDVIDVYVNLGIIGVLSSNVTTGTSVLPVSTPIFSNIPNGFEIFIGSISFGEILSKNSTAQSLSMEIASTQNFATGSPVTLRNRMMKNFVIGRASLYEFGISTIGASYMSEAYTVSTTYTNKSLTENKELIYHIEYLY
jgi:hypothetical protein